MLLTRDAILAAQDLKTEDVPVEEWGGTVRVRMLTGAERDAFGASLLDPKTGKPNMRDYMTKLLARCIVGEDGQALFAPDEVALLGAKSSTALQRVYAVAERLNSMSAASAEAAEGN